MSEGFDTPSGVVQPSLEQLQAQVDADGEAGPFDTELSETSSGCPDRGCPGFGLSGTAHDRAEFWGAVRDAYWRRMPDGTDPTPSVTEQLAADWTLSDTELDRALRADRTPEGSAAKPRVMLPGGCARQPPHPFCINETGSEGRLARSWLCEWCADRDGTVGGWQADASGRGSAPRVVWDVTYRSGIGVTSDGSLRFPGEEPWRAQFEQPAPTMEDWRETPPSEEVRLKVVGSSWSANFGRPSGLFIAPVGTPFPKAKTSEQVLQSIRDSLTSQGWTSLGTTSAPIQWQVGADTSDDDDVIITTERKTVTVARDEPFQPYDWTRDPEAAADFGGQMASSADAEKTPPRMPRDPQQVPTLREHLQASRFSHREREHIVALVHRWLTQNTEAGYGFDGTELIAELERK